jgi:hypothetical protein
MRLQPFHLVGRRWTGCYALVGLLACLGCRRGGDGAHQNPLFLFGELLKRNAAKPTKLPTPRPYAAPKVPLGINLSSVNYFATGIPFIDVMKMADPFLSTNAQSVDGVKDEWDTHVADKIARDADGYPLEIPAIVPGLRVPQIVRASVVASVYAGRYTLLYDGDGDFEFPASPATVVTRAPGRIELDVQATPERAIFLAITRSSRLNHVRNVRLILPGYEPVAAQQIFHPTFLGRIRGVGALRFMDWGGTNNSPLAHWADRSTETMSQGSSRGVAIETMIALANQLDADAWFCVPHLADDHYIEELAKLIKARLDPKHKAYIEYSNELWNGIFEQSHWAAKQGCSVGVNKLGKYSGSCDDDGSRYWAGIKWQARRSGQIFQIFDKVYGNDSSRVLRVLSGQAQNDHLNQVLLESFEDPLINTAHGAVDVLAVAPYAGHGIASQIAEQNQVSSISTREILDRLEQSIGPNVRDSTIENKKVADSHGVHLVGYEGGQHLVAYGGAENNQALVDKLIAANRDPRMRSIYSKLLDAWYTNSDNGLLMLFDYIEAPSKFGSWGLLESQEQRMETAPKYQAFYDRLQRLATASARPGSASPSASPSAAAPPLMAAPASPTAPIAPSHVAAPTAPSVSAPTAPSTPSTPRATEENARP